jgi:hypothetical protein
VGASKATQTRLRCSYVEVIATTIIRSSSPSGWPLRNIHISNDKGHFTFYADVCFPLSLPRLLPDLTVYMSNNGGCLIKSRNCYPSWAPDITRGFCGGVHVAHLFSFYVTTYFVFLRWVPWCDVRYDYRIKMMSGSSFPPVVCRRAHVLFALFMFVCA